MNRSLKHAALIAALLTTAAVGAGTASRPAEMAPLAAKNLLLDVKPAGDTLVAIGERGTVLRSADGAQWQQSPVPTQATLNTLAFADAKSGWAGGHDQSILHSTDGGQTWTEQHRNAEDSKPVLSLLALDAQRAFAAGAYGFLMTTADGGGTWTAVDAPAILDDGLHLNALIRLNNGDLFVAGETGLIGVSADGVQWTRLQQPYEGSLFGALPHGDAGAIVFGLRGNVLVTDDVRKGPWTALTTGTVQSFFGGTRLPNGEALLVGADGVTLRIGADGAVKNPGGTLSGLGTLSAALPWKDAVLVVGELGANRITTP